MIANECHANVRWYVGNDLNKKSRAVTGWWVQEMCYVLHSVIEQEGDLLCITPSLSGEEKILFIPDPKTSWREDGETYGAVRNGRDVGPGIRKSPGFVMAANAIIRERLLAGMDPFKASELSDKEIEELKRKHSA